MNKIAGFEDIQSWQKARELVSSVYTITKESAFSTDYALKNQISSAAVSIMSNIAEGFSRRTTKELVQFLFISKGSTAEVQSQLYIALDQGYIDRQKFDELYSSCHCERSAAIPINSTNSINWAWPGEGSPLCAG